MNFLRHYTKINITTANHKLNANQNPKKHCQFLLLACAYFKKYLESQDSVSLLLF